MKNAQLTLMILMGLILLAALFTIIWFGTKTATKRTAPEAEQQRLRQVAVQPVRDYVQSCIDQTAAEALELFGKQGGALYNTQGGPVLDPLPSDEGQPDGFALYQGFRVKYGIVPHHSDFAGYLFARPPDYPFITFPYVFKENNPGTREINKTLYVTYFGLSKLPPLFRPAENSVQAQLEAYITSNLPECADWATFEAQGLSVSAGKPNTTIVIAENLTQIETEEFFTVHVDWPVRVKDRTTGGETMMQEFSVSYPVHLAKFYVFVQEIAYNDANNGTFDPRNSSTPATPVTVIDEVRINEDLSDDEIIIIQDTQSFVRGKPLEFRLARKNRYPAMVWINETDLARYHFVSPKLCGSSQKTIILDGNELEVRLGDPGDWLATLSAVDPDEDNMTFKTYPSAPGEIIVNRAGDTFELFACVSDTGGAEGPTGDVSEDCQALMLQTRGCFGQ